jgi:xanthine/CO dehydrogenase XdhC/CoxF family maturation factor
MAKQQAYDAPDLIDLDRSDTWPVAVRDAAEQQAKMIRATGEIDLADLFDDAADTAVLALLHDHRVVAYHCTRLLDHEAIPIRSDGLTPLSKESVNSRIDAAHRHGPVSDDDRDLLRRATILTTRQPEPRRAGAVYLFSMST